jgi:hypothetical protein
MRYLYRGLTMQKKKYPDKHCAYCESVFTPTRDWQIFCSTRCRVGKFQDAKAAELEALKQELEELRRKNNG